MIVLLFLFVLCSCVVFAVYEEFRCFFPPPENKLETIGKLRGEKRLFVCPDKTNIDSMAFASSVDSDFVTGIRLTCGNEKDIAFSVQSNQDASVWEKPMKLAAGIKFPVVEESLACCPKQMDYNGESCLGSNVYWINKNSSYKGLVYDEYLQGMQLVRP